MERNRTSRRERVFAGPRFLIRLVELDMHPLDVRDRRDAAQEEFGPGRLQPHRVPHRGVPGGHRPDDNRIIPLKERVVDRSFDPLIWLGSKIGRRPRD